MTAPHALHKFLWLLIVPFVFAGACTSRPDPNDPATREAITEAQNLGLAFLEENRLGDAETQFTKLTELNPDDAMGYANLGIVYLRRGDFERARTNLEKATALNPDDPDIPLNLADTYARMDENQKAQDIITASLERSPDHVPTLYKRAQLLTDDPSSTKAFQAALNEVLSIASANIVPRIQLAISLTEGNELNVALFQLDELQQQLPELPKETQPHFSSALEALQSGDKDTALRGLRIFHNLMKVTPYYQTGLRLLGIRTDALAGVPVISAPTGFSQLLLSGASGNSDILDQMHFTNASENALLTSIFTPDQRMTSMTIADFDGDADTDLFVTAWDSGTSSSAFFLLKNEFGRFSDVTATSGLAPADSRTHQALWADVDNDTFLDLYLVNEQTHQLFRNQGDGTFENVSDKAGLSTVLSGRKATVADLDHDGDLDLFIAQTGRNLVLRNNADGTFTENASSMGLAGDANQTVHDVEIGDFDDDGDLDLLTVHEDGVSLYTNERQGIFVDVAASTGLGVINEAHTTAVGDYNNDGFLDVFFAGAQTNHLFLNDGSLFKPDEENQAILNTVNINEAVFIDVDNDGFLDLYLAGAQQLMWHNDGNGRFTDESGRLLPESSHQPLQATYTDYNLDRDLDLFLSTPAGPVLLRNDGGHLNRSLSIQTRGLLTNNSKNNYFSIGAKVEVRAGDLYQMRVVTSPTTYFGLGQRLKADVVRIVFTNGVPQNIFTPGTDQDIIEQQILKGSCPFLYTWNGSEFTFATDILWRSALGMPTGIMGGNTTYAPASPAEDYIKIPEGLLQPKQGLYEIRITGELWETPYFDEVKLLVVDHPDSVDVLIDEKFGPPPTTSLPIYSASTRHLPKSAFDEKGNDVLDKLAAPDGAYLTAGSPTRYQGLTDLHDLVLVPDPAIDADNSALYLKGWVFPTDASINVALTQNDVTPVPPHVQVKDQRGNWQTVIPNMGFPMGKNKMVRVDLRGKFLSNDHRVRIRTNMQIYWDHAFFAEELEAAPIRRTMLQPAAASLQYRGFSKMYRPSPTSPHLFDYNEVSKEAKWLDLEGNYTRFGDVLPLLQHSDDQYIIMNAGDEIALSFDEAAAPALPEGWQRDFILYSNGWLKDGDLNTASGKTVGPLPFMGMTTYPYGEHEAYPMTEENRRYIEEYNTRVVSQKVFRETFRPAP